jgi:hypothetical protein
VSIAATRRVSAIAAVPNVIRSEHEWHDENSEAQFDRLARDCHGLHSAIAQAA